MTFSSDKDKYVALGEAHPEWPVFMQAWWLDAVCGGRAGWDCLMSVSLNGEIEAAMPFFIKKQWFLTKNGLPSITPWLGVWLKNAPPETKKHSIFSKEKAMLTNLFAQMPATDIYDVNFQPGFSANLPIQQAGFRQTTRYSWVLDNLCDNKLIVQNFNRNTRRNVQKTASLLSIESSNDLDALYFLSKKNFARYGSAMPFSTDLLKKLDISLEKNHARQLFLAKNKAGNPVAAVYFCWNEHQSDLLISATDPQFRESGATIALLAAAVGFLENKTQKFDFNGSMAEPVAAVFRGLGAVPVPYSRFLKGRNWALDLLQFLKE